MVRFKGVNHLALATNDMNKTMRYWRELLGFRLVDSMGQPGYRHYFFALTENDTVAFFEWDGVQPLPHKDHGAPVKGPFGFDHVAFGVETEDDLWEMKDKLQAAGFHVSDVVDHGIIHSIYTHDPNGIPIEFCCDTPDIDIRNSPIMMDKTPVQNAQEGSEPLLEKWPRPLKRTPSAERNIYPGVGSEVYPFLK